MDEYYSAIQRFPEPLRNQLASVSEDIAMSVHEIRLRSGRPIQLATNVGPLALHKAVRNQQGTFVVGHTLLQECFFSLCEHSVHSYENQLAQGFFTIPGGHRVGLAGIVHMDGDAFKGFQAVTSLNVRIARTIQPILPVEIRQHLMGDFRGLVLVGAPGSGKTTLLRSISALLSSYGKKVSIVDERMEIWPCGPQGFAAPVPLHCDVLSGVNKQQGILTALRGLGPQVILCDELGDKHDMLTVAKGSQGGVSFVCTIHGDDLSAMERRFDCDRSFLAQSFSCCALLEGSQNPCKIKEVCWL